MNNQPRSLSSMSSSRSEITTALSDSGLGTSSTKRKHLTVVFETFFLLLGTMTFSIIRCWIISRIRLWKNRRSVFVGFENPWGNDKINNYWKQKHRTRVISMLLDAWIWFFDAFSNLTTRALIRGRLERWRASIGVKVRGCNSWTSSSSTRSGSPINLLSFEASASISSSRMAFQDKLRLKKYLWMQKWVPIPPRRTFTLWIGIRKVLIYMFRRHTQDPVQSTASLNKNKFFGHIQIASQVRQPLRRYLSHE